MSSKEGERIAWTAAVQRSLEGCVLELFLLEGCVLKLLLFLPSVLAMSVTLGSHNWHHSLYRNTPSIVPLGIYTARLVNE